MVAGVLMLRLPTYAENMYFGSSLVFTSPFLSFSLSLSIYLYILLNPPSFLPSFLPFPTLPQIAPIQSKTAKNASLNSSSSSACHSHDWPYLPPPLDYSSSSANSAERSPLAWCVRYLYFLLSHRGRKGNVYLFVYLSIRD